MDFDIEWIWFAVFVVIMLARALGSRRRALRSSRKRPTQGAAEAREKPQRTTDAAATGRMPPPIEPR